MCVCLSDVNENSESMKTVAHINFVLTFANHVTQLSRTC